MAPAASQVQTALRRGWQCSPGDCVAVTDALWRVGIGAELFAVKWVSGRRRTAFEAGLCAAQHVETGGTGAGDPVRSADGSLTVADGDGDGVLALLRWVPGRPLDAGDPLDQQWWGSTLGSVHRSLRQFVHPGLAKFHLVPDDAPHFTLESWLRPAVRDAVAATRRLFVTDQLTYGVLHGEPYAVDFRLDPETGRVGLVGWTGAGTGPLVYDLARAVLFAGGPAAAVDLIDAYLHGGPVSPDECEAALPVLLRLRAAEVAERVAAKIYADGGTPRDHALLGSAAGWLLA